VEELSTSELVSAIEGSPCEFAAHVGQLSQVELSDQTDMLWYATGIATPVWNGVLRTQLAPSETDSRIAPLADYFGSLGLPFAWWVGPSTTPLDIGKLLEAHGLTLRGDMAGMAVHLGTLEERSSPLTNLTITPVRSIETLRAWAHPLSVAFGWSNSAVSTLCNLFASLGLTQDRPLQHYVGLLDGKPVASSSVFLGADVAGVYNVGTLPDQRRRGIGAALTCEPLYYASRMDYRIGVLHSSRMGFNVYSQIGFKEYCRIRTYVSALV